MQGLESKKEKRIIYKRKRKLLLPSEKLRLDNKVIENFLNLNEYKQSQNILVYISKETEIYTGSIIERALQDKKKVAAPRCANMAGGMEFYYIKGVEDLEKGCFEIFEPIIHKCVKVSDFNSCLCVVPGLSFDRNGYRLGYGKGFYDRFLKRFNGVSVGLCYKDNIEENLPTDRFDEKVDIVVTNETVILINKEK